MSDDAIKVRRRGAKFAQTPEWVLYHAKLSDRAIRLFAVLDRHAWSGSHHPSRADLGRLLRCSVDSVDRAIAELEKAEALEVERRPVAADRNLTNLYTVVHDDPVGVGRAGAAQVGRGSAAGVGRGAAAEGKEKIPTDREGSRRPESAVPDLDEPDDDDVRTPAEVVDVLKAARAELKKSGGRG
jgi:hypothetical protein